MSSYASRAEVLDVVRASIAADSACTGLSRDPADFNLAAIVRESFHYRGPGYGWGASDPDTFTAALRRNLRRPAAPSTVQPSTPTPGATAMPRAFTLTPAAVQVLAGCTATATTVTLPPGTLDPKVYKEVDKALGRIGGGGSWNRRAKTHGFPRDPRDELAAMVTAGVAPTGEPDPDREVSFFRTPADLAARLVHELADVPVGGRVLEPSAGEGAILHALHAFRRDLRVAAVEVDDRRHAHLAADFAERIGEDLTLVQGRFQDFAPGEIDDYDAVVMNPPFSEPGDARAWVTHLEAAWSLVRPGGLLLAIVPRSLEYGEDRRTTAVRDLVREFGGWTQLPPDTFRASGVNVLTLLVSMSRPDPEDEDGAYDWE